MQQYGREGNEGQTRADTGSTKEQEPTLSLLLHVGINIFLAIDALASAGFTPIMLIIAPMSGHCPYCPSLPSWRLHKAHADFTRVLHRTLEKPYRHDRPANRRHQEMTCTKE